MKLYKEIPAGVTQDASADLKHSQKILHLFQCYYHQLKPKKTLKTNPRSATGASFLTAGHNMRMAGILQSYTGV